MNDATNDAIGQVNAAFSASVSADIIKRSKVLTSCTTPDGKVYVPMRFVINGSQWLADTPEGASSGLASFGNGFKKEELYKTNNRQILNDLLVPIGKLLPVAFERMVSVKPEETSMIKFIGKDDAKAVAEQYATGYNPKTKQYVINTEMAQAAEKWARSADDSYLVTMKVNFEPNQNTQQLINLVDSTLKYSVINIADYRRRLPREEFMQLMKQTQTDAYTEIYTNWGDLNSVKYKHISGRYNLPLEARKEWQEKLENMFFDELCNFVIIDNAGNRSDFPTREALGKIETGWSDLAGLFTLNADGSTYLNHGISGAYMLQGNGLFSPFVIFDYTLFSSSIEDRLGFGFPWSRDEKVYPNWEMQFLIPKSDISKYTGFRAIRK